MFQNRVNTCLLVTLIKFSIFMIYKHLKNLEFLVYSLNFTQNLNSTTSHDSLYNSILKWLVAPNLLGELKTWNIGGKKTDVQTHGFTFKFYNR